jgi:hypothetical protein
VNASEGVLYRPLVWVLAIGLVASGVLLTIQMISTVVGPFRLAEIGASDPRGVVAFWQPPTSVAGTHLRSAIGRDLVATGRAVREFVGLGDLDPAREGSVVFSDARHLDAANLEELSRYLEKGGGAVLVGPIATLDEAGAPIGTGAMRAFLGADVVALGARKEASLFAAKRGPIASALAPKQEARLVAMENPLGLARSDAELRWSGDDAPAASLRVTRGNGRLAWLAAAPDAAASDLDRRLLQHLQEAAIAWVSRTAWVEVLPDPEGAPPATRRDQTAWMLVRGAVDASVRRAGPRRLIVEVTNNARLPVEGLVLRVHMNDPVPAGARVETTALMQAEAVLRPVPGADAIDLVLPTIDARRSRAYSLDFELAPPSAG